MTVREFIKSFVSMYEEIMIVHFPETDKAMEMLFAGTGINDTIPEEVMKRRVRIVTVISNKLWITTEAKEDEQ